MILRPFNAALNTTPRILRLGYSSCRCPPGVRPRFITSDAADYKTRYGQKLQQKAEQEGISLTELIEKAKAEQNLMCQEKVSRFEAKAQRVKCGSVSGDKPPTHQLNERKDAPPFKSLSSIINLPRILSTPHTVDQISTLWTAYHASRSGGTGRGYVCACVPLSLYQNMQQTGRRYPSFVVPIPRVQSSATASENNESNIAHEFYFLQWDLHPAPPIPSVSDDPFAMLKESSDNHSNPQIATVLFTPLEEYKLRGAFATPYLVLTMYTDLATTHGTILLRGEITPSNSAGAGRYMLSQEDAQLLTLSLQKFYLWNGGEGQGDEGVQLLRTFHENPQDFSWQDVLKFSESIL